MEKSLGSYTTKLHEILAELFYSPEKDRSIRKSLRLYNLTFVHALLIKGDLKILTQRNSNDPCT